MTHIASVSAFGSSTDGRRRQGVGRPELGLQGPVAVGVVPQRHVDLLQHQRVLRGWNEESI